MRGEKISGDGLGCTTLPQLQASHSLPFSIQLATRQERVRFCDLLNLVTVDPELMLSLEYAPIPQHLFRKQKNAKLKVMGIPYILLFIGPQRNLNFPWEQQNGESSK